MIFSEMKYGMKRKVLKDLLMFFEEVEFEKKK